MNKDKIKKLILEFMSKNKFITREQIKMLIDYKERVILTEKEIDDVVLEIGFINKYGKLYLKNK